MGKKANIEKLRNAEYRLNQQENDFKKARDQHSVGRLVGVIGCVAIGSIILRIIVGVNDDPNFNSLMILLATVGSIWWWASPSKSGLEHLRYEVEKWKGLVKDFKSQCEDAK